MSQPLAIGVTRKGLTTPTDLRNVRHALRNNEMALQYISRFLSYANSVLSAAERFKRTPYCEARAQVHYGNMLFEVSRLQTHLEQ